MPPIFSSKNLCMALHIHFLLLVHHASTSMVSIALFLLNSCWVKVVTTQPKSSS